MPKKHLKVPKGDTPQHNHFKSISVLFYIFRHDWHISVNFDADHYYVVPSSAFLYYSAPLDTFKQPQPFFAIFVTNHSTQFTFLMLQLQCVLLIYSDLEKLRYSINFLVNESGGCYVSWTIIKNRFVAGAYSANTRNTSGFRYYNCYDFTVHTTSGVTIPKQGLYAKQYDLLQHSPLKIPKMSPFLKSDLERLKNNFDSKLNEHWINIDKSVNANIFNSNYKWKQTSAKKPKEKRQTNMKTKPFQIKQ